MLHVGVNAERSEDAALRDVLDLDEIIHLVPDGMMKLLTDEPLIAYCGYDCSDRIPKPGAVANCVVCIEMSKARHG
jgi:hypothetical protein